MTARELDHLAIAVPQWTDASWFLSGELGARWLAGFEAGEFSPGLVGFEADMRIELLQPAADPHSFVHRFLRKRGGAAPHHVTFKVADIEVTLAAIVEHGFTPMLVRTDNSQWREVFLHPKETGLGFLLQAVEASFDPATDGGAPPGIRPIWAAPTTPPPAFPALTCVVADWERPMAALVGVLGAEVHCWSAQTRRFRWSEGADLLVTCDPDALVLGIEAAVIGGAARQELSLDDLARCSRRYVSELGMTFLNFNI